MKIKLIKTENGEWIRQVYFTKEEDLTRWFSRAFSNGY